MQPIMIGDRQVPFCRHMDGSMPVAIQMKKSLACPQSLFSAPFPYFEPCSNFVTFAFNPSPFLLHPLCAHKIMTTCAISQIFKHSFYPLTPNNLPPSNPSQTTHSVRTNPSGLPLYGDPFFMRLPSTQTKGAKPCDSKNTTSPPSTPPPHHAKPTSNPPPLPSPPSSCPIFSTQPTPRTKSANSTPSPSPSSPTSPTQPSSSKPSPKSNPSTTTDPKR